MTTPTIPKAITAYVSAKKCKHTFAIDATTLLPSPIVTLKHSEQSFIRAYVSELETSLVKQATKVDQDRVYHLCRIYHYYMREQTCIQLVSTKHVSRLNTLVTALNTFMNTYANALESITVMLYNEKLPQTQEQV